MECPFGRKPHQWGGTGDDADPDEPADPLETRVLSDWPHPYDTWAGIYRAGARFGWTPDAVESMYLWQFKGALGLDLPPTPEQVKATDAAKARQAMDARANRLRDLPEDVALERQARMDSRDRRRERQRADPQWRDEVRRNREREKVPHPERVIKAEDGEPDIMIVR